MFVGKISEVVMRCFLLDIHGAFCHSLLFRVCMTVVDFLIYIQAAEWSPS